ncbi:Peptidase family M28 [Planctomycetes bacterium Pan216]|uniref:Peptidase family M28 n=1 Tax=Kolteria novifilia TaxID=2527975 RepID=A0A518BA20_9BACT|nr:Peptidase family M28 [Planctomycetes bacterium Pan216]
MLSPPASAVEFAPPVTASVFDGDRAYEYLKGICALGPRMSASDAMRRQQELLKEHFETLGATVELQRFEGRQPSLGQRTFPCANLIVRWHPETKRRVLLGAHYDTRPKADQEPIFRNREKPFLGANDGASGVAFLMELGRVIPQLDLKVGVDFVLFDAEEYIVDKNRDRYFLGSEYFVDQYVNSRPDYRYEKVIVVDMIADRELEIFPDQRSAAKAGRLVGEVFGIANELRLRQFVPRVKYDVLDDHVAFQKKGIPAIVLIDFDYPHWHRLTDTPKRCSGESLEVVSRVIIEWLRRQQ